MRLSKLWPAGFLGLSWFLWIVSASGASEGGPHAGESGLFPVREERAVISARRAVIIRPPELDWPENAGPETILEAFLGLPFRADGVPDQWGRWVTFANPEKVRPGPGYNCSGFTLAAARFLLGENITLAEAVRDRGHDSGPEAALGRDWDFGLDLVLNVTENHPRRFLPPADPGRAWIAPEEGSGRPLGLGVDIHGSDFSSLLEELRRGFLYFFVISKPDRRFKGGLSYYHVGLILPAPTGEIWLYQVTANGRTYRVDLAGQRGLANFRRYFPPLKPGAGQRRLFLVETPLRRWP